MNQSRLEGKVGLFVFIGLVLLALLMLQFSKGTTFFRKTYEIHLKVSNVGGLRARTAVLMSGVQVGTVSDIKLARDGKTVTINLKIFSNYKIHGDARFTIEQSGFLGDQYISIVPTENKTDVLPQQPPFAEVTAEEPFNLQEAARSASGFFQHIDETTKKINDIVVDVRKQMFNEETLTNLSHAVANLRRVSDQALVTVDNIAALVQTNSPNISQSVSNLSAFSTRLTVVGDSLQQVVSDSRTQISSAIKNIETSTAMLTNVLNDVQSGKGLAGTLLKNDAVSANVTHIVENLSITTSNLNRLGLWKILWRPREVKLMTTNEPTSKISQSPKASAE